MQPWRTASMWARRAPHASGLLTLAPSTKGNAPQSRLLGSLSALYEYKPQSLPRCLLGPKSIPVAESAPSNLGVGCNVDEFQKMDAATYACLLRRCGNAKSLLDAKRLHRHMIGSGYSCDRLLWNLLVQAYGKCGSLEDARAVFDNIRQPNVFSWNILMAAYAQNGCLEGARRLFDKMPQRDVVSWNSMIAAYAQNGHGKMALELFREMDVECVKSDQITFVSILDACAGLTALGEGKAIHANIVDGAFESDVVGNALVNMYGKC
eukprot:c24584_g7_i2 orf=65-859(+)